MKIENGNMKIKLPKIRFQSSCFISKAFKNETNIPKTKNAQNNANELSPKIALPKLASPAVQ